MRKWVESELQRCLAVHDRISLRAPLHDDWKEAREAVRRALKACEELRRLAAWLNVKPYALAEPSQEAEPPEPDRGSPLSSFARIL